MTDRPANWFRPRLRRDAGLLMDYLAFHGTKVYLDPERRADIEDRTRLDRYRVDEALAALYRLGCIDIALAGNTEVVRLLDMDLDRAATAPPAAPTSMPRFTFTRTGRA